jgi:cytochrome P450
MVTASLPAGPKGTLLGGNLPELRRDWLGVLTRYARTYGDFVPLRFGPRRAFLLNHPDLVEEVQVTKQRNFVKSQVLRNGRRLLGNGLLVSEGDFWRRQRRLMQPAFHRQQVAGYGQVMVERTLSQLERWPEGEVLDVHEAMMSLTLEIVARTLFGVDIGPATAEAQAAIEVLLKRFRERIDSWQFMLPDTLPIPGNLAFLRSAKRLDAIIFEIIEQRRASGRDHGDLLSTLLAAQDEDGSQMTDRQLRDEVMTLFLAGHETTAIALSWTFYLLACHPEQEASLAAELAAVLGDRSPTSADLPSLPYLERVVSESLRLYPPAWSQGREALEACEIGGYPVPRGGTLLFSQWVIQRDPRWFDQPESFQPERWADGLARRLPRFAYFPFGGGPRLCIGQPFALMEAALILATVLQRYRLDLASSEPIVPWPSITMRPKQGLPMRPTRRSVQSQAAAATGSTG